jgi:hypothetical protein
MDRAQVNTQLEIRATFYADGVGTAPSPNSATVTILRADGTAIITAQVATPVTPGPTVPSGTFSYTLTPAQNNRLDRLTATFTSSLGIAVTTVEIASGFLISSADLVALYPNDTNAVRAQRRVDIEQRLEGACGVAFVQRYEKELVTARGTRRTVVVLGWGNVRSIRSLSVRGVAYTTDQITALDVNWRQGKVMWLPSSWRHGEVVIEYEHGADFLAADARMAAYDAMTETFGPDRVDGRVLLKQVDRVSVQYAAPRAQTTEFVTPSVVNFIGSNQRVMVG